MGRLWVDFTCDLFNCNDKYDAVFVWSTIKRTCACADSNVTEAFLTDLSYYSCKINPCYITVVAFGCRRTTAAVK